MSGRIRIHTLCMYVLHTYVCALTYILNALSRRDAVMTRVHLLELVVLSLYACMHVCMYTNWSLWAGGAWSGLELPMWHVECGVHHFGAAWRLSHVWHARYSTAYGYDWATVWTYTKVRFVHDTWSYVCNLWMPCTVYTWTHTFSDGLIVQSMHVSYVQTTHVSCV